jgi:hypothetical protein
MNPKISLFLAFILGCGFQPCPAQDQPIDLNDNLAVASFPSNLEKTDGERLYAILRTHGIIITGGKGDDGWQSVNVPRSQADEARKLIAEAIKTEGLNARLAPLDEWIPSPDGKLRIFATTSASYDDLDSQKSEAYLQDDGVNRVIWIFTRICRGMKFSWSPDSSHFLFGVADKNKSMTLYYLDANERRPPGNDLKEHDLDLARVARQVAARLPVRKQGNLAPHDWIDFDHVTWDSATKCRLVYFYMCDHQAGSAALSVDLAESNPQIEITEVTSQPEP